MRLALAFLLACGAVSAAETDFTLTLGEERFDPVRSTPQLPSGLDRSVDEGPDLHVGQPKGLTGELDVPFDVR